MGFRRWQLKGSSLTQLCPRLCILLGLSSPSTEAVMRQGTGKGRPCTFIPWAIPPGRARSRGRKLARGWRETSRAGGPCVWMPALLNVASSVTGSGMGRLSGSAEKSAAWQWAAGSGQCVLARPGPGYWALGSAPCGLLWFPHTPAPHGVFTPPPLPSTQAGFDPRLKCHELMVTTQKFSVSHPRETLLGKYL